MGCLVVSRSPAFRMQGYEGTEGLFGKGFGMLDLCLQWTLAVWLSGFLALEFRLLLALAQRLPEP